MNQLLVPRFEFGLTRIKARDRRLPSVPEHGPLEDAMKKSMWVVAAVLSAPLAVGLAGAQQEGAVAATEEGPVEMPYGQAEFLNSCAACHGEDGRGRGPIAGELLNPPADLTLLTRGNDGAFPYYRVFAVIDGRYLVQGHGEREMPVWGRQFIEEDARMFGKHGGEMITTERIHELTGYIESLQR
jgi:mono/diheme cytochrome c family protein